MYAVKYGKKTRKVAGCYKTKASAKKKVDSYYNVRVAKK